jgi:hypothetical protein
VIFLITEHNLRIETPKAGIRLRSPLSEFHVMVMVHGQASEGLKKQYHD